MKMTDKNTRLELFEQLEGKFAFQARFVTLMTGLSGYFMVDYMGAWGRYQQSPFWWVYLMILVRGIFTFVLFVLESLVLINGLKNKR